MRKTLCGVPIAALLLSSCVVVGEGSTTTTTTTEVDDKPDETTDDKSDEPPTPAGDSSATPIGTGGLYARGISQSDLAAGAPGEVTVIALIKPQGDGPGDTDEIGAVVRNNTEQVVFNVKVNAIARDGSGSIIGTTDNSGLTVPQAVAPGEIGVSILFPPDEIDLDDVDDWEAEVGGFDVEKPGFERFLLEVVELPVSETETITARNQYDLELSNYSADILCFDDEATPVGAFISITSDFPLKPGAEASYHTYGAIPAPCDGVIAAVDASKS